MIIFLKKLFLYITILAVFALHANNYIVKKNDTLSSIAAITFAQQKIYGHTGSLNKLLLLNPSIKNPNLIFPGQKIKLTTLTKINNKKEPYTKIEIKEKPIFTASYYFSSLSLNATDENNLDATVETNYNHGLHFNLRTFWHKKYYFDTFIDMSFTNFDNGNSNLSQNKFQNISFGIAFLKKISTLDFGLHYMSQNTYYIQSTNTENAIFKNTLLHKIGPSIYLSILKTSSQEFFIQTNISYILGKDTIGTKYENGHGADLNFGQTIRLSNFNITTSLFYKYNDLSRNNSDDVLREFGIKIGRSYDFF
ncbi:MAG: LysM peptidoglycan-binding domain-containing protein [Bacteriovoracaceae bacterium]|nr:LysM peptidoglycan-binding domain-containing protein [Bacteriovoracaceae bacterium]